MLTKTKASQRILDPSATIKKAKYFSNLMGITRVSNVTGLDYIGINVVMVTRPNSRSVSVSQGKGTTLNDAMASGLMESIETWHAERIAENKIIIEPACNLNQYVNLDKLPRVNKRRININKAIHWIKGVNLFTKIDCWVPIDLVHSNFTDTRVDDQLFISCTNGLASGNHYLEATLHGIYELIERDSLTLWNLLPVEIKKTTRVNLQSVDNSDTKELLERFKDANFEVGVWEITSDIGIPAFVSSIFPRNGQYHFSAWASVGSGCHLDIQTALRRALTEAAQVRATCIVGAREDLITSNYIEDRKTETRIIKAYLDECKTNSMRDINKINSEVTDRLDIDLEIVLNKLDRINISQAVVVDLTDENIQIPVVRVVIPGLEGPDAHANYMPGKRAENHSKNYVK